MPPDLELDRAALREVERLIEEVGADDGASSARLLTSGGWVSGRADAVDVGSAVCADRLSTVLACLDASGVAIRQAAAELGDSIGAVRDAFTTTDRGLAALGRW